MKRDFNPAVQEDVKEFKFYMKNNKWKKGCPFNLKFPYMDLPSMCKDMFIKYTLNIK